MSSITSTFGHPPHWVFIAAPIATLVTVVIITIVVLVHFRKKTESKRTELQERKKGISSLLLTK
jgi:septation ring formation regulator EzrA